MDPLLVQDEEDEFAHQVGICRVALLYSFQLGVCLAQLSDDLHCLHCRIVAHGVHDLVHLPRCDAKMLSQSIPRLVGRVVSLHHRCKQVEEYRQCHEWRIGLGVGIEVCNYLVCLEHVFGNDGIFQFPVVVFLADSDVEFNQFGCYGRRVFWYCDGSPTILLRSAPIYSVMIIRAGLSICRLRSARYSVMKPGSAESFNF